MRRHDPMTAAFGALLARRHGRAESTPVARMRRDGIEAIVVAIAVPFTLFGRRRDIAGVSGRPVYCWFSWTTNS